jgi:hypothetical protein
MDSSSYELQERYSEATGLQVHWGTPETFVREPGQEWQQWSSGRRSTAIPMWDHVPFPRKMLIASSVESVKPSPSRLAGHNAVQTHNSSSGGTIR